MAIFVTSYYLQFLSFGSNYFCVRLSREKKKSERLRETLNHKIRTLGALFEYAIILLQMKIKTFRKLAASMVKGVCVCVFTRFLSGAST